MNPDEYSNGLNDRYVEGQYPSPPYLPPMSQDPGIPPKAQRPSIRERGLIIAILVLTIIGSCNINNNDSVYDGSSRAIHDYFSYQNDANGNVIDGDSLDSVSRVSLRQLSSKDLASKDGTAKNQIALWTVITNGTSRAFTFHDLEISELPENTTAKYVSGVQTVLPGASVLAVVVLDPAEPLSDEQLEFATIDWLADAGGDGVTVTNVVSPNAEQGALLDAAYEGAVAKQLRDYQK